MKHEELSGRSAAAGRPAASPASKTAPNSDWLKLEGRSQPRGAPPGRSDKLAILAALKHERSSGCNGSVAGSRGSSKGAAVGKKTDRSLRRKRRKRRVSAKRRAAGVAACRLPVRLSVSLQRLMQLPPVSNRVEVVRAVWAYAKQKQLQQPGDPHTVQCDCVLKRLFGGLESVNLFADLNRLLLPHLIYTDAEDGTAASAAARQEKKPPKDLLASMCPQPHASVPAEADAAHLAARRPGGETKQEPHEGRADAPSGQEQKPQTTQDLQPQLRLKLSDMRAQSEALGAEETADDAVAQSTAHAKIATTGKSVLRPSSKQEQAGGSTPTASTTLGSVEYEQRKRVDLWSPRACQIFAQGLDLPPLSPAFEAWGVRGSELLQIGASELSTFGIPVNPTPQPFMAKSLTKCLVPAKMRPYSIVAFLRPAKLFSGAIKRSRILFVVFVLDAVGTAVANFSLMRPRAYSPPFAGVIRILTTTAEEASGSPSPSPASIKRRAAVGAAPSGRSAASVRPGERRELSGCYRLGVPRDEHHQADCRYLAVFNAGGKRRCIDGGTTRISFPGFYVDAAVYGDKGVRRQMEDERLVLPSLATLEPSLKPQRDFAVFAILDGHGGRQSASFVKATLPLEIATQLKLAGKALAERELAGVENGRAMLCIASCEMRLLVALLQVLYAAFRKIDSRIATEIPACRGMYTPEGSAFRCGVCGVLGMCADFVLEALEFKLYEGLLCGLAMHADGCTAVFLLMLARQAFIAGLGDSAAYLARKHETGYHAIPLTETHRPYLLAEKERILRMGGSIEGGRVNGQLELTRSFGDIPLKRYGVSCVPTIRKISLCPSQDEFLLVACDGFWGAWGASEAINKTAEFIQKASHSSQLHSLAISPALATAAFRGEEKRSAKVNSRPFDPSAVCRQLVDYVLVDRKAQDNVSVLLILINEGEAPAKSEA
ncbi:protein phosphatase 2c domain-containing protein [Cyclospora cayetanensis]|uniref:protein-serine/threonine phosphatase n=1 Tax=Cyclospora cayetanensis TaxID=88456 RepID=A0A1D3DAZ2_9EIME|nr:protein phosphatase 2c domain-containing protein [Cyclospora cayetanensis]